MNHEVLRCLQQILINIFFSDRRPSKSMWACPSAAVRGTTQLLSNRQSTTTAGHYCYLRSSTRVVEALRLARTRSQDDEPSLLLPTYGICLHPGGRMLTAHEEQPETAPESNTWK